MIFCSFPVAIEPSSSRGLIIFANDIETKEILEASRNEEYSIVQSCDEIEIIIFTQYVMQLSLGRCVI